MPEIRKAQAVILSKLNYGDTSLILSLFTKEEGKLSVILKGARSPRSKSGSVADVLNVVDIVFYKKDNRDMQLVTQIDLVKHYSIIKEDLEKLKYASSVLELVNKLTVDHESHIRLYNGIVRILDLINEKKNETQLLFVKFFVFFIKEIGYELQFGNCSACQKEIKSEKSASFNYVEGILCEECGRDHLGLYQFDEELLKILVVINDKTKRFNYTSLSLNRIIKFLEKYLMFQISEFKGIKSLELF